ncbi:MAG: hypothetical protein QOJ92_2127 [Frankiales bacterium]|nr:hypothetical protein [Frankiales bacterium]
MTSTSCAVLIDIDGTLVDSNYLHLFAWLKAFQDADHPVDGRALHRALGMGSDLLIEKLLGSSDPDPGLVERIQKVHSEEYADLTSLLRPFDGAADLLEALQARGLHVVLATSASPDELERVAKVLPIDEYDVVGGEDVENAKPEPDLVAAALAKAGVPAERAMFIGDTVWDVEAASRAGVPCIGLLTGGISMSELIGAGAIAVYPSPQTLLDDLDDSPLAPLWA